MAERRVLDADGSGAIVPEGGVTLESLITRIDNVEARLEASERAVGERDRVIDRLRSELRASEPARGPDIGGSLTDRRQLLKHAGAAAAGVAVGSLALAATADQAAATNGDFVVLGSASNASTASTDIVTDVPAGPGIVGLAVADQAVPTFPGTAALVGHSNGRFGNAVFGYHQSGGNGVCGQVDGAGGTGVVGFAANGIGGSFRGGRANASLAPGGLAPLLRNDNHIVGELVLDADGNLWMCVAAGSPGQWRFIAGPKRSDALTVLDTPIRTYDSRPGFPPLNVQKGPLQTGEERDIPVDSPGLAVPDGAKVFVNLTATETGPAGFLSVYRVGIPWPGTSNVNWSRPGETVANLSALPILGGLFRARASSQAHLVTDLVIIITPKIVQSPD